MAGPNLDGPYLALLKHSGTSTGKGEFVFKTGSMNTVRSIAGVLQTAGGQHIAVTMIVMTMFQSVKNLRPAFSDLIALLNQITSITIIPPKPGSGDKEEAVIQTQERWLLRRASRATADAGAKDLKPSESNDLVKTFESKS